MGAVERDEFASQVFEVERCADNVVHLHKDGLNMPLVKVAMSFDDDV